MLSQERSNFLNNRLSSYIKLEDQDKFYLYLVKLSKSNDRQTCELRMNKKDGTSFDVQLETTICLTEKGEPEKYRIMIIDIGERKRSEEILVVERNKLKDANKKIKELSGMLSICSKCKNIRDDKGYWNKLELYIEGHSDTKFTHGLCPDCSEQLYGNNDWYIKMKTKQNSGDKDI